MQADYSVELGREDDCLEVPWASPDGLQRYYNLKAQPELLLQVSEASYNRDLGEFLEAINGPHSALETAKCDTWLTNELSEDEDVFEAVWKFGCYVDVIFSNGLGRLSFEAHEGLAKDVSLLLRKVPEISAAAELVVRRCHFHLADQPDDSEPGFCISLYLFGYGDDEDQARRRWGVAIKLVQNALMQATGKSSRQ
jgi:hypothetical protein